MPSISRPAGLASLDSHCYRLTHKGRACVAFVQSGHQTTGSLSRHMHDLLAMCGTGVWFDQLKQFMPPRSLDDSLSALLALDLIEEVDLVPALLPRGDGQASAASMR